MVDPGAEGGAGLARGMVDLLVDEDGAVGDLKHAGLHREGLAGVRFLDEADVLVAGDERCLRPGAEGVAEAGGVRELVQPLHHPGDVEAHIHVPHLVAFPGVDAAAIDF
jgi:hypothetical protein